MATPKWLILLGIIFVINGALGHRWETVAGFSMVDPITTERDCERLKFLTYQQKKICRLYIDFMEAVREGAREALEECKHQFRNRRWNCTFFDSRDLFGGLLRSGTKETAFIYSILAAGVTQSVARACSSGRLKKCGCDRTLSGMSEEGFEWTGCSDNVAYGSAFTLKFLDSREHLRKKALIPRALMNLHNNNIGRKAVEKNMKIQCKCHGVSGSCEVKTCWKTLPDFRIVGDELRSRYDRSTRVVLERVGSHAELIPSKNSHDDEDEFYPTRKMESRNGIRSGIKNKNRNNRKKTKSKKAEESDAAAADSSKLPSTTTHVDTTTSYTTSEDTTTSASTLTTPLSSTEKVGDRFRRLTGDEVEAQQRQKKNKVWISHGRDSISRRHDSKKDKKPDHKNNNMSGFRTEVGHQTPNNQEPGRYPRMPMDSEVTSRKEKNFQNLQSRRHWQEMEQKRQIQRKRRERIIRRQRQGEIDRSLPETTPLMRRRQDSSVMTKRQTFNGNLHPVQFYTSSSIFVHNKSTGTRDNFENHMVHLDLSPDYCSLDVQIGSLGTQGRTCSIDGAEGNCSVLCCGRGYSVKRSIVTERCHCRFQWCCEVKCQKCRREVVEYTCR